MNAMGETEFEVVHDNVGGGEVDDDVRLGVDKRLEGVVAVDLGDEFQVVGGGNASNYGLSDSALCS